MNIIHCLFWIRNNTVSSLLYEANGLRILKIEGKKAVPFDKSFWKEWIGYAGFCQGDRTDFCFVYDEEPVCDESLTEQQCDPNDCIWSVSRIQSAAERLAIEEPTEICAENGILLTKAGSFLNVKPEGVVSMKARYIQAVRDAQPEDTSQEKQTPLIEYYKRELRKYKEGYNK